MCSSPNGCSPSLLYAVLQALWGLLILGLAVGKINAFPSGAAMFLEHFTNWSWALQGLFYLATLAFVVPSRPGRCCDVRCAGHVVALCFLPLNAVVWFVATAVLVLLITDPEFITDMMEVMGAGVVIVGNDVFHTLPVLALVLFAALQHHLVWYGLNRWFAPAAAIPDRTARCCALTWLAVYEAAGGALLFGGLYLLVLWAAYGKSVNDVYGTDVPLASGFALFLLVSLLVSGVPLLILSCCYGLWQPPLHPDLAERRVYETLGQMVDDRDLLDLLDRDRRRRAAVAAAAAGAGQTSASSSVAHKISFDIYSPPTKKLK